ncbi:MULTISPECIES: malic enzyme-like NAD(P)-binding protein [unclassified Campylobacter]|uniref:malic enzyme-like NAD(P)-binding protein n=1 Tax=unclassified Campylobacter TaxID=2593542 RepID=UPI001BDB2E0F|nr:MULTISPECIES: malic enzyme-like NAD(P)-binding protein [unclassified Campylobacter]MBT0880433.1 malate dehydrogenase [Campylobacter sp. 2018MI27]MBT0884948.1 malate dehydrogenase [Campylobacter sp. 2018MI10]
MNNLKERALEYHLGGKLGTFIKTPMKEYESLSLAYSPGVAYPCEEIARDSDLAYKYTSKGNLVAVISDGSAVLGLGNIGGIAGKPVMEGKACLFKKFANVDSYDIELSTQDTEEIIAAVKAIAPSFGGINLEDIAAPKCFEIEARLQDLGIPVMHDDQHGTAIISAAGLINACEIIGKKLEDLKVVVCGAGAAGIASAKIYKTLGVKKIYLVDSKGVCNTKRTDLNEHKLEFVRECDEDTLADVLKGADVFLGLSKAGALSEEMLKTMAENPIVFALANPDPEILPELAKKVRPDVIIATGRSDYDNQINNVLGFPYIFRGALDVRARKISMGMKIAAVKALSELGRLVVSEKTKKLYGKDLKYGKDLIIPKPFDDRVKAYVSTAVAKAAVDEGIALVKNFDDKAYFERLLNESN